MNDPFFAVLIVLLILFGGLILLYLGTVIYRICIHIQYINMEIGRTIGRERQYWIRQRRRLFFPFLFRKHKRP